MKIKLTVLLFILVSASCALVSAQIRKPVVPQKTDDKVERIETDDFENDFAEKGLPEPGIIGFNPTAQLAKPIAAKISRYDEESLPLLIAALQKAGFYIIDQNQKTLYAPTYGEGVGMAFYDFEVVGMLKASKLGAGTTVAKIANLISQKDSTLQTHVNGRFILYDLNLALKSADPQIAFLAGLIFEFGRNFPAPVDLETVSPENAKINIIQASLIERMFLRDFIASYENSLSSSFYPSNLFERQTNRVNFVNASWKRMFSPCETVTEISNLQKTEKNGKKIVETVAIFWQLANDYDKVGTKIKIPIPSTGDIKFEKLILSEEKYKKYADGMKKMNAALGWAKLIMALMNVKIKVDVQDPMPLVRVKHNRKPGGETKLVTGQFSLDIKNSEMLNCVGKALGIATNVKFSVPKNGPLTDKPVSWELIDSGEGPEKFTDNPVYLDALNATDTSKQKTNAQGENKVNLTGKPQKENLENQPVVPLPKKAVVRVSIATEKMDLGEDAPTIMGLFGAEIDPLSLFSMIPNILGKAKLSVAGFSVPVRDWQPCSDDWSGTIDYKRELVPNPKIIVVKANRSSNGNSTGDGVRKISRIDEASITLNPRLPEEMETKPPNPAQIFARGKHSDIFEGSREGDPCCGPVEGSYSTKFRTGAIGSYSQIVNQPVNVVFRGTERDYSLSFGFFTDKMKYNLNNFTEISSTNCPLESDDAKSNDGESTFFLQPSLPDGRYGERFSTPRGDALKGSKEVIHPNGSVETWNWELIRCKS